MMLMKLLMGVIIPYLIKQYSYHCYNLFLCIAIWNECNQCYVLCMYAMSASVMIITVSQ